MATVVIPFANPGIAGVTVGDEYTQIEVFYGEQQLLTEPYTVAAGVTALPIYSVVGLNASNELIPAVEGNFFGVTTAPAKAGDVIDIYRQAYFNDQALVWPAGTDTLPKRKAAFIGSKSPGILVNRIPTHGRVIPNRTGIVSA